MTAAIAKFSNGPATATRMSRAGSGLVWAVSSIRVTPPMGNRMMERTAMPLRRATTACASSCSTTQPKMMPTSASPRPGPETPMDSDSENHTKPSRNRKVMWTRMSTPNNLPAGNDQPLMKRAILNPYSIHSFYKERLAENKLCASSPVNIAAAL